MKNIFLSDRFFLLFAIITGVFVLSFPFGFLFPLAQTLFVLGLAIVLVDLMLLFGGKEKIKVRRYLPKVFSLGDPNRVRVGLENLTEQKFKLKVIDELPIQFQIRNFEKVLDLEPEETQTINYKLTPKSRGEYTFGAVNVYVETFLGLVQRRIRHDYKMTVPVYPSILQMKSLELKAFDRMTLSTGIKRIRRVGHSYEFEQIKTYVRGDDYRSINWKASSRRAALMVNQYQDERAQQVYSIIDKSRAMRMPFNDLSLMDYAINASLVMSNIALQKHDRAGLLTFSDIIGTAIKADRKPTQLNKILLALYKEKERDLEANYELLYHSARKLITGRSLLMLYTNFESMYALERVLPILRRINTLHLLVVIFFENTEINDFAKMKVMTTEDIYHQTIAQKFLNEKSQMVQKLKQYGIQAVLTKPEDLSVNSINKYLELKSRGLI